jgi:hypothetical protein
MSERDDEMSEAQRRLSADLARELSPGPDVEDRIVAALRARGLIRTSWTRSRFAARLAAAAAGLALLAAGFAVGRASTPRPGEEPAQTRFALFLLRGAEALPENPVEEAGRVAEYRSWARGLAGAGRFVSGEKLEDRAEQIGAPAGAVASASEEEVRGFFIISAESFDDALAIARQCPHLRHGGRILVRPIARD